MSGHRQQTYSSVFREEKQSNPSGSTPRLFAACIAACLALFLLFGGSSSNSPSAHRVAAHAQQPIAVEPTVRYETRNIEDLVAGDRVVAWDEETGRLGLKPIEETFRHHVNHVRHLSIEDATGGREAIETTDIHPFWVECEGCVSASNLVPGDQLRDGQGRPATMLATRREEHPEGIEVFNFRVADWHTYLVASSVARSTPVVVHNANDVACGLYEVGMAKDLRRNPLHGWDTGTIAEHVPRTMWAKQLIPDHNPINKNGWEAAIRVTKDEAERITAAERLTRVPASAREALAQKIMILRQNTKAPNSALWELIDLNVKKHFYDYSVK